jgi:hypothetical protein
MFDDCAALSNIQEKRGLREWVTYDWSNRRFELAVTAARWTDGFRSHRLPFIRGGYIEIHKALCSSR